MSCKISFKCPRYPQDNKLPKPNQDAKQEVKIPIRSLWKGKIEF